MFVKREVLTCWYRFAVAFTRAAPEVRVKVSRQRRCWYNRIATLHPEIGAKLDQLQAPLEVLRRIAFASGAAKQRERAIEVISELIEKRDRDRRVA